MLRDILDKYVKESEGTIERPSPTGDIERSSIGMKTTGSHRFLTVEVPTGSYLIAIADTNSMEPCFDNGDLVILCPCDPFTIHIGDIVVYKIPEITSLIIHRVIAIEEVPDNRLFTFKGDNNPGNDPWRCTTSQIVARYNGHIVPKRKPDTT